MGRMIRLSLLAVVLLSCSCVAGGRLDEVVYLQRLEESDVPDPTEWVRFANICESLALKGGARRIPTMDSYPQEGCRWWWLTRHDSTISFDVEVCPDVTAYGASLGAPNAIVGTWPRWWNPYSAAEAAAKRAAVYDALRHEFGDRVKVKRLEL